MSKQLEIIWKNVVDYEGIYLISSNGEIYSNFSNKILKQSVGTSGYLCINLHKNKKQKSRLVHQLMAESFLSHKRQKFKIVIDHIDNNKLNNNINNIQLLSNRKNSTKDKKPKSGESCIYKSNSKYLVRLRINGKKKSIGIFKDINDAIICRDEFLKQIDFFEQTEHDKISNLF